MPLILPLPLQDTDVVSVVHLRDPQWDVLKRLVRAQDALRALPADQNVTQANLIQIAIQEIQVVIEEVAQRLLPDFPELSPEDLAEIREEVPA